MCPWLTVTMTSFPTPCAIEKLSSQTLQNAQSSHSDGTMYSHFAVYESLNRCTCARFCCRVEVGSLISTFRFPLCVSIVNFKNTTPSGDIPREHYRQHCQYRLWGLRYIACGLASSIIKRNMHISNRWRHILNASTARNYRKKYI